MELTHKAEERLMARSVSDPSGQWDSSLEAGEAYAAALHAEGLRTRQEKRAGKERARASIGAGNELRDLTSTYGAEAVLSWVHGREAADAAAAEASFRVRDLEAHVKELEARAPVAPEAQPVQEAPTPQEAPSLPWSVVSSILQRAETRGLRFPSPGEAYAFAVRTLGAFA